MQDWPRLEFKCRDRTLPCGGRVHIMGILNVTPDSFSDGGRHASVDDAVAHGLQMIEDGAAILDIGGESTRPGFSPVPADEELKRVVPVIHELRRQSDILISVDTSKSIVAAAAVDAGAQIINDVTGGQQDFQGMTDLLRRSAAGYILMHWNQTISPSAESDGGGLEAIQKEIAEQTQRILHGSGLSADHVMIDPGIGFGKTQRQNERMVSHAGAFRSLGFPVLLGPSRKSFIGNILHQEQPQQRLWGTAAAVAIGAWCGADVVRVHDVAVMRDVLSVTETLKRSSLSIVL